MASGPVRRTNRPNTWLHRPSLRREDSPCQPGAVHTWHISEVTNEAADFRLGGQSGLNANVARTAAFDADHVRADAAELIRGSPDLIVTEGPVPTIEAGKATPAIPIVFVQVPDPVDLASWQAWRVRAEISPASPISNWRSRENGWRRSRTRRRRCAVSSSSRSPSILRCPDSCARSRLWSHLPA